MKKKYNFLEKVRKHQEDAEKPMRDRGIALIVNSLQQPAVKVLQGVCEKQMKDSVELFKTIGWIK